jgi:hypothetical protein
MEGRRLERGDVEMREEVVCVEEEKRGVVEKRANEEVVE